MSIVLPKDLIHNSYGDQHKFKRKGGKNSLGLCYNALREKSLSIHEGLRVAVGRYYDRYKSAHRHQRE